MCNTMVVSTGVEICWSLINRVSSQRMCQYNWSKFYYNGLHYRGKASNNNNQTYTMCKENAIRNHIGLRNPLTNKQNSKPYCMKLSLLFLISWTQFYKLMNIADASKTTLCLKVLTENKAEKERRIKIFILLVCLHDAGIWENSNE